MSVKSITSAIAITCITPAALAAPAGLTLLSESYQLQGHLWGSMYMPPQPPLYQPRTYDQSFNSPANTPISNALANPDSPYPNHASASAGPFSIAVSAEVLDGYATVSAHGNWTFQPQSPALSLTLDLAAITGNLYYTDTYLLSLQDLTSNSSLLNLNRTGLDAITYANTHAWPIPASYSLTVDPTHTYSLSLDLSTTANNDSHASTFAPTLAALPEPATLPLLALSLLLLPRRRRSV